MKLSKLGSADKYKARLRLAQIDRTSCTVTMEVKNSDETVKRGGVEQT